MASQPRGENLSIVPRVHEIIDASVENDGMTGTAPERPRLAGVARLGRGWLTHAEVEEAAAFDADLGVACTVAVDGAGSTLAIIAFAPVLETVVGLRADEAVIAGEEDAEPACADPLRAALIVAAGRAIPDVVGPAADPQDAVAAEGQHHPAE